MKLPLLGSVTLLVASVGCSLDLPEIARSHPANAEASTGQQYATPAVLEVRPFIRPPDKPTTKPGHRMEHESENMQKAAPRREEQPMQHMQHEGQLHE